MRNYKHKSCPGVTFKWRGGHTVNIFRGDREVDVMSVGDFSRDKATAKEVASAITRYARSSCGRDLGGVRRKKTSAGRSTRPAEGFTLVRHGARSNVGWYLTREEAEKEARRMVYDQYRVVPMSSLDGVRRRSRRSR